MMKAIAERTRTLKPDAVQGTRGLHLVPILGPSHETPAYRLLDADTLPSVKVTEINESGSVPELLVESVLDTRVFLMDGQELVGAKQNRILNTDVLVPTKARLKIPVSCVEAGRWRYKSETFAPGKAASFAIRSGKQERVHESLRESGRHDADQGAVWQEVSESLQKAACSSPTSALHDAYANREQDLVDFRSTLRLPDDAVGVAVFDGNEFRGLDIFDRHSTLQYFWDSLVDSYAIEWLGRCDDPKSAKHNGADTVAAILTQVAGANWETFRSPGEGEEGRFATENLAGSTLVWEQQAIIHLQVFPTRRSRQPGKPHYQPRVHRQYRPDEEPPRVY